MLSKEKYRSSLTVAKLTALLTKINRLATAKALRLVVQRGADIWRGETLSAFTITPASATGTVLLTTSGRYGVSAAGKVIQDLTYAAKQVGDWYANDVRIKYVDPGADGALAVSVLEHDITVTLAYATGAVTSTADEIKAAIEALPAANALVGITVSGTGTNVQAACAFTAMTGGSNAHSYDKADITAIKRLRWRKYKIVLTPDADPAA